jgi:hypothetical protein
MSLFTNIKKRYARITPKQFVLTGVFMLAMAGAIGGGFASKQSSMASGIRDCSPNSVINKNAPNCGALTKTELVSDIKANREGDLKTIFSHFGLSSSKYSDFKSNAKYGKFYRDGRLVVDGQTVATNAYSMGRHNFGGSKAYTKISSGTYYYGTPSQRWASGTNSMDVMVWFNKDGTVKMAVISACGNPVPQFSKKTPKAQCDDLNKHAVKGKKNTYRFSTDASKNSLAKFVKFKYYYNNGSGDKLFDTTTKASTKTKEITFTKAATVKVKIEVSLPGGNKKTVTSKECETKIGVVKEEFLYKCEALVKTQGDNRIFRFTVQTKQSNNVTVDSADFTLDDNVTSKNVTEKDADGNIYKEYDFSDNKEHTVSAIVNFTADGKKVTSKEGDCVAKVLPEEKPECPEKPGSGLPPGHPDCEEPEMPVTGAGSVAGLFAGVTAAGAIGHRLYSNRRNRLS